jgi:hypothetical protein
MNVGFHAEAPKGHWDNSHFRRDPGGTWEVVSGKHKVLWYNSDLCHMAIRNSRKCKKLP